MAFVTAVQINDPLLQGLELVTANNIIAVNIISNNMFSSTFMKTEHSIHGLLTQVSRVVKMKVKSFPILDWRRKL